MVSDLELTCELFSEAMAILYKTFEMSVPSEVNDKVLEADAILDETHETLLLAYNNGKLCKEMYVEIRGYRDTSQTYLFYAKETFDKYGDEISSCDFGDIDDYIRDALYWVSKAKVYLICSDQ